MATGTNTFQYLWPHTPMVAQRCRTARLLTDKAFWGWRAAILYSYRNMFTEGGWWAASYMPPTAMLWRVAMKGSEHLKKLLKVTLSGIACRQSVGLRLLSSTYVHSNISFISSFTVTYRSRFLSFSVIVSTGLHKVRAHTKELPARFFLYLKHDLCISFTLWHSIL